MAEAYPTTKETIECQECEEQIDTNETVEIRGFERSESVREARLRIICKTVMNHGRCYIGYDETNQRLLRPIFRTATGQCCWPENQEFEIGGSYLFTVLYDRDIPSLVEPPTPFPHRHDDLLVSEMTSPQDGSRDSWTPNVLENVAHMNIHDIFPRNAIREGKYVYENTQCPSVGILKENESNVHVVNRFGKTHVLLNDLYDFPITSSKYDQPVPGGQRRALVLLGLGRPFSGTNNQFHPARCYILVIGIFLY